MEVYTLWQNLIPDKFRKQQSIRNPLNPLSIGFHCNKNLEIYLPGIEAFFRQFGRSDFPPLWIRPFKVNTPGQRYELKNSRTTHELVEGGRGTQSGGFDFQKTPGGAMVPGTTA
jgi:hypothetical protein